VEASRRFLCSYVQSLAVIRKHPQGDSVKGKMIIEDDVNCLSRMKRKVEAHRPQPKSWTKPPRGWTKLNVDGSFVEDTGESGAGMVLRTDDGTIVFSACRYLGRSSTPLATELAACMEGIALARQWSEGPCIVEMDSTEAVALIHQKISGRPAEAYLVHEIKHLVGGDEKFKIELIRREQNNVSHVLANLSRSTMRTNFWLGSGPENIPVLAQEESFAPL
jgi:ribonuclease HI